MPRYGDWIDPDDVRAVSSGVGSGSWTRRWHRQAAAATDLATLVETVWGGGPYTESFPYTLPPVSGQVRASQTQAGFINYGPPWNAEGTFQGDWNPTLLRLPIPHTLPLRNPLGYQIAEDGVVLSEVAFGIPESEWPEGAIGYEYESDYGAWTTAPLLDLRPCYANYDTVLSSNYDHPSRVVLAPEEFGNTTSPDASLFPHRGRFGAWEHLWSGVPPLSITGTTNTVATQYAVPDTRENFVFFVGPEYAFSGDDFRDGGIGLSMGYTLRRTFEMPRHRFIFKGGMWELRQRATGGAVPGGHPLRARGRAGATGTWRTRAR